MIFATVWFSINGNSSNTEASFENDFNLTKREIQILKKIVDGWSNKQIAEDADISVRTIETHRLNIMKKMTAFMVNLTVNLEPVYGIVLAVLIFGEREKMHLGFYIGSSLISLAVLAYPLLNKPYGNKYLEAETIH